LGEGLDSAFVPAEFSKETFIMRGVTFAVLTGMLALGGSAYAGDLEGEYLEARNADVWTGPCFANAEIGIVGNKATLAWKVTSGSFDKVRLDGLCVVAVVIGNGTFGIEKDIKTKTAFIVDERADAAQQKALIDLARKSAGETIQEVVAVTTAPISMSTAYCNEKGCATLQAGDTKIKTRCMHEKDSICGHETISYPPMADVTGVYAAYALEHVYTGPAFGETFRDNNARSAMLGKFTL
jgi:hypothetical protein